MQQEQRSTRDYLQAHFETSGSEDDPNILGKLSDTEAIRWIDILHGK